ncbi:hypothetical protein FS837_003129 [Tulasnella sp. UAMH 9824]|nr:hypothetical protein FS837_003129 [Tulasnella sp. UAMH 9824]
MSNHTQLPGTVAPSQLMLNYLVMQDPADSQLGHGDIDSLPGQDVIMEDSVQSGQRIEALSLASQQAHSPGSGPSSPKGSDGHLSMKDLIVMEDDSGDHQDIQEAPVGPDIQGGGEGGAANDNGHRSPGEGGIPPEPSDTGDQDTFSKEPAKTLDKGKGRAPSPPGSEILSGSGSAAPGPRYEIFLPDKTPYPGLPDDKNDFIYREVDREFLERVRTNGARDNNPMMKMWRKDTGAIYQWGYQTPFVTINPGDKIEAFFGLNHLISVSIDNKCGADILLEWLYTGPEAKEVIENSEISEARKEALYKQLPVSLAKYKMWFKDMWSSRPSKWNGVPTESIIRNPGPRWMCERIGDYLKLIHEVDEEIRECRQNIAGLKVKEKEEERLIKELTLIKMERSGGKPGPSRFPRPMTTRSASKGQLKGAK